jgi:AcrR family transcriptional regulator
MSEREQARASKPGASGTRNAPGRSKRSKKQSAKKPARSQRKKAASKVADARARMYHDLIFVSAEVVFGERGYDGATMQEIADACGVSLKTLYATYASKRDLYNQIMIDRATAFVQAMRGALVGEDDPLSRIHRGVAAYVAFLFDHEDWLRIHLRTRVAWAFRPADENVAIWWKEGHEEYARVLSQGMQAGLFYEGDPTDTAITLQTLMQVHVARAVERGESDPEAVSNAIMVQVGRLLCRPDSLARTQLESC